MNVFVVLRQYVRPDNAGFVLVIPEAVAKTMEQAFGHCVELAGKFLASNAGCRIERADNRISVFDSAGIEVRFVVKKAHELDSSNYKPTK